MGKYGIPYQGSKGRIADALIRVLPSGRRFVDLFGGGGAMTHCAALSGKYERVLYNEIQPNLVKLMRDAVEGKYSYDVFTPEWISREEFFARKEQDAYVKYIWSFSSGGDTYLYAREIEEQKHSIHEYIVHGSRDGYIEENFPGVTLTGKTIEERRKEWCKKMNAGVKRGSVRKLNTKSQSLERTQLQHLEKQGFLDRMGLLFEQSESIRREIHLERADALERLKLAPPLIEFSCMDYRDYEYAEGDVVYCDPPYEDAAGYDMDFDTKGFYEWAWTRPYPVYFSSYDDISDKRFIPVWAKEKRNLMNGAKGYDMRVETLYCNKDTDFRFNNYAYVKAQREQKQISLFDKGGDE